MLLSPEQKTRQKDLLLKKKSMTGIWVQINRTYRQEDELCPLSGGLLDRLASMGDVPLLVGGHR